MLGAWLWERVTPLLASPHVAIDLPGRGNHPADPGDVRLSDAVESVVRGRGRRRKSSASHSGSAASGSHWCHAADRSRKDLDRCRDRPDDRARLPVGGQRQAQGANHAQEA
ncbi:MAG: hypothetical protein M3O70_07145 [Actinomycetota bacterium]|nr:hypothetical protein [Actinomycetota bacterium]